MDALWAPKLSPAELATRTAAAKLSSGAAVVVQELAREPCTGLMRVVAHVQRSVPALLEAHSGVDAATQRLRAVGEQLADAQEGVFAVVGPATQQELAQLAASLERAEAALAALRRRRLAREAAEAAASDAAAAAGTDASGSGGGGGEAAGAAARRR